MRPSRLMTSDAVHRRQAGIVLFEGMTMFGSFRFKAALLSAAVLFAAGCDKSGTELAVRTSSTGSAGRAAPADEPGKNLVGTWEATEDDVYDKNGPSRTTVEFKADGRMSFKTGPVEMNGSWKVAKEEGKVLTVDTEMMVPDSGGKREKNSDKKTFVITFENENTVVMTPTGKKDPMTLKRKKVTASASGPA